MSRIVTRDFVDGLTTGYRNDFNKALAAAQPKYPRLAMVVDSQNESEDYSWLGATAVPREWTDERVPRGLRGFHFEIVNKKYENTIEVDRTAMEDDKLGQIPPRIRDLATRAAMHPDYLITQLLNGAFSTACYDGSYLCADAHSEGDSGSQDNAETHKLDATYLPAAITAMMNFKDDQGQVIGIEPDLLVVGPENLFNARKLLNSAQITVSGSEALVTQSSTMNGVLDLLVLPGLSTNYWFVMATKQYLKALIFQWRIKPEFTAVTDPNSEGVFDSDVFKYGTRSRCAAGYGDWRYIFGSTGAA